MLTEHCRALVTVLILPPTRFPSILFRKHASLLVQDVEIPRTEKSTAQPSILAISYLPDTKAFYRVDGLFSFFLSGTTHGAIQMEGQFVPGISGVEGRIVINRKSGVCRVPHFSNKKKKNTVTKIGIKVELLISQAPRAQMAMRETVRHPGKLSVFSYIQFSTRNLGPGNKCCG
jgi:hypothetical protein